MDEKKVDEKKLEDVNGGSALVLTYMYRCPKCGERVRAPQRAPSDPLRCIRCGEAMSVVPGSGENQRVVG